MKITKKEQTVEDFSKPERLYSDQELQDFHNKIQKFWDTPRQVILAEGMSGPAQKFRYEDLIVSYGAARKIKHGRTFVYQYNSERYNEFSNLWNQYEEWQKKQDWIESKQNEGLEKMAEEIPF